MPSKRNRQQDPFERINKWDDGYDYVRDGMPSPPLGRDRAAFYPPPMPSRRESDRYTKEPRGGDRTWQAYPSPPAEYERDSRSRRQPRERSPPPAYRSTRSPSPDWNRDERGRSSGSRPKPGLSRSRSMRDAPPRFYSRSPSPTPRRRETERQGDRSYRQERHRSPSPLRAGMRHGDYDRRGYSPPSSGERRRSTKTRSPSPMRRAPPKEVPHRPSLSRSKSTFAKDRFAGLSPRWQQAAVAAFQAGSMAALKQPGTWNGEKGARIATAALGAAAMKAFASKDDKDRKKGSSERRKSGGVDGLGGALGGFLADQFAKRESKKSGTRY